MYKAHGLVNEAKFFNHIIRTYKDSMVSTKEYNHKEQRNETIEYINLPCAFDIEASSFYYNMCKCACMYHWQFGIDGYVIKGRTWESFETMINTLSEILGLNHTRRLVCFVHNLPYEFQWIKDRFSWNSIFAREKRSPMKAVTTTGIEFRCSYILSGMSLELTCKNLVKYKTKKKVGDLDYDLIRSPETPMTKKETGYCIYDVIGVMNYIQEEIENYGDITKIPLTNTGKVRMYCREKCFSKENAKAYRSIMKGLTLSGVEEYNILKDAFTAGFTHANWQNSAEVFTNVASKDFTSSYPSVMVCERHPMSSGEWIRAKNIKQIEALFREYYVVFKVELHNVKEKENIPDHYISYSRCKGCKGEQLDNGRLISADRIQMTINSDDWDIIKACYTFDEPIIGKAIRYQLGYLPRVFVQCVLDFYKGKTTLKDVTSEDGSIERMYLQKKGMLNSTFGMSVTDIVNPEITFDEDWDETETNAEEAIKDYNKSKTRFLFYPWGLSICSKARKNLWSGIIALGQDYIYSDTDATKFCNPEKHEEYFQKYNKKIEEKMKLACKVNKLNFEDTCPETVEGKKKPLGVWDDDGTYTKFKTLGAKRYLVEYVGEDGEKHIKATIAGVNKKMVSKFLSEKEDPFEYFTDKMCVDEDHSGRLIHFYIDKPFEFELTDYLGNHYDGKELSAVFMEKSDFHLKLSPMYSILLGLGE